MRMMEKVVQDMILMIAHRWYLPEVSAMNGLKIGLGLGRNHFAVKDEN